MPATRLVPGIAAMLLMTAPVAVAQTEATRPVTSCAAPRAATARSGLQQAEQVTLTMQDAIALAQQHVGGKVVEAGLLLRGGDASYTVVALPNVREVWRGSVDANSGVLLDERMTRLKDARASDQVDPAQAGLAAEARLRLPEAVQRAEAHSGGRVLDASLQNANGRPTYEVQVARGDDVEDLVVNAANGAVTLATD